MQPEDPQPLAASVQDKQTSRSHSTNGKDDSQPTEQKYRKLRLRFDALKLVRISSLTTTSYPCPNSSPVALTQKLLDRQTPSSVCHGAQWLQATRSKAWRSNRQSTNQFHFAGILTDPLELGRIKLARVVTNS